MSVLCTTGISIDSQTVRDYHRVHDLEPNPARNLIVLPLMGGWFNSRATAGRFRGSRMSSLLSRIATPSVRAAFHHLIRIA